MINENITRIGKNVRIYKYASMHNINPNPTKLSICNGTLKKFLILSTAVKFSVV